MARPQGEWEAYQNQYAATSQSANPYGQYQPQQSQAGYAQEPASTSYQSAAGQQAYDPQGGYAGNFYQQQPYQHLSQGPQAGGGYGGPPGTDAFVTEMAAGVLRQQGENYFQRGQAFVQSKMGFLSAGNLQHHFNIDTTYVRDKLFLLLLPFLRQWSFQRKPEQISGGHRYQSPRQDTYSPDLYIPFMAACTYVVLVSAAQTQAGKFTHDNMYLTVSSSFSAWAVHWVVIKAVLYLLGVPSAVPFLENLAYAGYPFVYACLGILAAAVGGLWPYRVVLLYGGLAMGTFMVRTMKHVLMHDSPHFNGRAKGNYMLLGLALFQFPFLAWLYVKA